MIKLICLLKRKPGMTRDAFIERYERVHAKLGEKHVPNAVRYVRRYLEAVPGLFTGDMVEPEHDVITELWFADRAQFDIAMHRLAIPDVVAEIVEDEEQIFDRPRHRMFVVNERESVVNAEVAE